MGAADVRKTPSAGIQKPSLYFDSMEQYRQEAVKTLSDLLVSGLSSVQEDVLSALLLLAEDGERLGLSFAAEEFTVIHDLLAGRRHGMDFTPEPVIDAMGRLGRYLKACGEKLSFDRALNAIYFIKESYTSYPKVTDNNAVPA